MSKKIIKTDKASLPSALIIKAVSIGNYLHGRTDPAG